MYHKTRIYVDVWFYLLIVEKKYENSVLIALKLTLELFLKRIFAARSFIPFAKWHGKNQVSPGDRLIIFHQFIETDCKAYFAENRFP